MSLQIGAQAAQEARRRAEVCPLAYARLWHREPPQTSQREALLRLAEPGVLTLLLLGGNRSGKSAVAARWAVACAAGRSASVETPTGPLYYVQKFLAANGLPLSIIPPKPGRVWVGSPTFASAVEQIRPHIQRNCPGGTSFIQWGNKQSEAEARLPNGGVLVSKAYRQYDQNPDSWEGAQIQGLVLDEQPNHPENVYAALSRLVDLRGQCLWSVTPLRGKNDWLYQEFYKKAPPTLRSYHIHGRDNPHIPQDRLELMLSSVPKWQRESREYGLFTSPEGLIYQQWNPDVHVVAPFEVPKEWQRYVGIDWGGRTAHIVWAAEDPRGSLWVYRELAIRRGTLEPAVPVSKLIAMAKELEAGSLDLKLFLYRTADSEDPGAIEEAAGQGWLCDPVEKGTGSVLWGIGLVEALLSTIDPITLQAQEPRLKVFSSCSVLTGELGEYKWQEGGQLKPSATCSDHGCDALRYLVMYRAALGKV